jgi:hypothetical protein
MFSYVYQHPKIKSIFTMYIYLKAWIFILYPHAGHCAGIYLHDYILKETFEHTYMVRKSGLPLNAPSGITEIELLWNPLERQENNILKCISPMK